MCDSDVLCVVSPQKHIVGAHGPQEVAWKGHTREIHDRATYMRHRGGAEALDTRHSVRGDSLRTREEASSAGKRQKTILL